MVKRAERYHFRLIDTSFGVFVLFFVQGTVVKRVYRCCFAYYGLFGRYYVVFSVSGGQSGGGAALIWSRQGLFGVFIMFFSLGGGRSGGVITLSLGSSIPILACCTISSVEAGQSKRWDRCCSARQGLFWHFNRTFFSLGGGQSRGATGHVLGPIPGLLWRF